MLAYGSLWGRSYHEGASVLGPILRPRTEWKRPFDDATHVTSKRLSCLKLPILAQLELPEPQQYVK